MNRSRPRLKNGVDLQLQSAFSDGNWPVVIRLAEKRMRMLNDQYYQIMKVVAESQLDDPAHKLAAVTALYQYVKDGTVIKDVDAIDLLEWAAGDLTHEDEFLETLGPLRVRAVKAAPKDKVSASRALESCLLHWDLVSSQQIAATLDRSFPQERQFLFWNIVVTYLLSTSSQADATKKKLYGTLALKQIERAAQATEQAFQADSAAPAPARGIQSEEEILLLYDIMETHGSSADLEKVVSSSVFGPISQFRRGRKEPLLRVIANNRSSGNWISIFRLCNDCLSEVDESGEPNLLASDWSIWKEFIAAANHIKSSDESAPKTVQELLLKLSKSTKLRPIYKRNLQLARVSAAFYLATNDPEDSGSDAVSSLQLQELTKYIEVHATSPACFDDIKPFIELLGPLGMKKLASEILPNLYQRNENEIRASKAIKVLTLKVQYFISTSPLSYTTFQGSFSSYKCSVCESETDTSSCLSCFSTLSQQGIQLYKSITEESPDGFSAEPDTLSELVLLIAFCSLQHAKLNSKPPYSAESTRHILQAMLLLEHQLAFNPKNSQFLLLLLQMHLLVGSAPRSRQLLEDLTIKRTIMDSLGPLFYDRLSTLSPNVLSPSDNTGWQVMDMLSSHFNVSLKLRMPRRLVDAFEAESYSSVLSIPKYINDLRRSCTRAISLVEENRSERLLGCPTWEFFSEDRYTETTDDTELKSVIDYGSFPSWESSAVSPLYSHLRVGPIPSNRRLHLALLAEGFQETLGYKPPAAYKVANTALGSDQLFVLESLSQISNSLSRFLSGPDDELTAPETVYYDLINVLSTLIPLCATNPRSAGFEEAIGELTKATEAALDTLRVQLPSEDDDSLEGTISALGSMHGLAMYRDAAVAISGTAQWILDFNKLEKERDRSGQSNLPKDTVGQVTALQSAAAAALKDGQSRVSGLKGRVQGSFQSRLKTWVFEGADDIRDIVEDDIVADFAAHIRENVQGWQHVKWE
ncbi:unnamed protein product [Clonostachys rosea]|uniref:N-acetyltransferase B complex non catalytic subunit n=1 Tax=Bionectria ochroleuca TaxID=29856 RepID=A0ABY6U148_BIOOC|nr:unnamed protein product [Clonostachys rosea]